MAENGITHGDDGVSRCAWAGPSLDDRAYHDTEWGLPVSDDVRLFEKLSLEGFQSGLSWLTILGKREAFRRAFAGFDFTRVVRRPNDRVRVHAGDGPRQRSPCRVRRRATVERARAEFDRP